MDIFVVRSYDGEFAAFWDVDGFNFKIFCPTKLDGGVHDVDMARWNTVSGIKSITGNYPKLFHAAHYELSMRNLDFDILHVQKSVMQLGWYYSRVWRGVTNPELFMSYEPILLTPAEHAAKLQATNAANSLYGELEALFRYVEPEGKNLKAYGHKFRELLILACTEVESNWRSIIEANTSAPSQNKVYKTNDYVKLIPLLRLLEWEVSLKNYFNNSTIKPFDGWTGIRPTQSLAWYDAYNSVKHNREGEFGRATLENVLNALAAVHVLQAAQWGPNIYSEWHGNAYSPFRTVRLPAPELTSVYVCPDQITSSRQYFFG